MLSGASPERRVSEGLPIGSPPAVWVITRSETEDSWASALPAINTSQKPIERNPDFSDERKLSPYGKEHLSHSYHLTPKPDQMLENSRNESDSGPGTRCPGTLPVLVRCARSIRRTLSEPAARYA